MQAWRDLRAKEASGAGRVLTDPEWAEAHLRIRVKPNLWTVDPGAKANTTIQPLRYSGIQNKLNDALDGMRAEEGRAMLIVLKARQMGVSTWIASRMFTRATREEGVGCLMVGCDDENVLHLWSMHQMFLQYAPHPPTDYSNRKEVVYSMPHHSLIAVQIAGAKTGTGRTLRMLHASEKAKWADVVATDTSLMQSAEAADVIIESTGNGIAGVGQPFYEEWRDAMRGKSDYFPLFFGWFEDERYQIPQDSVWFERVMADRPVTDEEGALVEKHGLSNEQLAWRRWAIRNLCRRDESIFRQEYPANESEAFQRIEGTRVFSIVQCNLGAARARDPLVRGRLLWAVEPRLDAAGDCLNKKQLSVKFQPDENGPLKVWEMPPEVLPRPQDYLIIGAADVARGVEGGDLNCCPILHRRKRKILARWTELSDASLFGTHCAMLAMWYGAMIAPEVNDAGQSVLDKMFDLLGPEYLWAQHRFSPGVVSDTRAKNAYGWRTGPGNHEQMVQALVDIVNDNPGASVWEDPDADFWGQASATIREPSGKAHITGLDLVASACILAMFDRMALPVRGQREELGPDFRRAKKRPPRRSGLSSRKAVMGR